MTPITSPCCVLTMTRCPNNIWSHQPPRGTNFKKPFLVICRTIKPISSMCPASMTLGPWPSWRQIKLPILSCSIAPSGSTRLRMRARTSCSNPGTPWALVSSCSNFSLASKWLFLSCLFYQELTFSTKAPATKKLPFDVFVGLLTGSDKRRLSYPISTELSSGGWGIGDWVLGIGYWVLGEISRQVVAVGHNNEFGIKRMASVRRKFVPFSIRSDCNSPRSVLGGRRTFRESSGKVGS